MGRIMRPATVAWQRGLVCTLDPCTLEVRLRSFYRCSGGTLLSVTPYSLMTPDGLIP